MGIFKIEAQHKDDIFDLKIKELHVGFRELGVNDFPKDYVEYPKTLNVNDVPSFHTSLTNTWYKRTRSNDALLILEKAYERAKKHNSN